MKSQNSHFSPYAFPHLSLWSTLDRSWNVDPTYLVVQEVIVTPLYFSHSPHWGKVWRLCKSTQSKRQRWRKAQAVTMHILSVGCWRRRWLYAHVPGRPMGHHYLSARKGPRFTSDTPYTTGLLHYTKCKADARHSKSGGNQVLADYDPTGTFVHALNISGCNGLRQILKHWLI